VACHLEARTLPPMTVRGTEPTTSALERLRLLLGDQLPSSGAGSTDCNPHRRHETQSSTGAPAVARDDMPRRNDATLASVAGL
jgi:hypothetical protein